ncbi:helix-turn-helix domain-containing protein [Aquabacterium sp. A7-Y]|uniref:GlxA family transcriptional regulator n=1 Tax=Aquabacterium sp. A7-Y TaxID=1349605 RepID=UPI00223DF30B|nr:helix-turn-helix domain-containing protein [Aquabacterium sp. A7-Y]MCW7541147.1 helix-turn-helix domain-containing protein [Aquabacterium sp. A7-Y]
MATHQQFPRGAGGESAHGATRGCRLVASAGAIAGCIDVLFVIAPDSILLDIAGPAEAFRLANLHRARRGLPPRYQLRFSGPMPSLTTSVPLALAGLETLPPRLTSSTWVILVGQPAVYASQPTPAIAAIAQWLNRTFDASLHPGNTPDRLITICSGALLAARAGLIAERRCTTHHELLGTLRALAPRAQVVGNRVFVVDGLLASSAGITAGIDLALHLIAGDCGDALAAAVSQDMVVYLRRSPADPEMSPFLVHRRHQHAAVHRVQDAISAEPQRDWNMAALAEVGHVTERHLLRLFLNHAGVSPLHYLQVIRLERARQWLEHGASITRAAEVAGFCSTLSLRRAWGRKWGGSPRDARRADRP